MNYSKENGELSTSKICTLSSVIACTTSAAKLTCLLAFLTLFSSCLIGKGRIEVTSSNKNTTPLNFSVANVQIINHQFIITGAGLDNVTEFKIKNGAITTDLEIESKSNTSIIANTLSNMSFAAGTIFDFVLSSASAASAFQVTFTNANNTITAAMLTSMGATTGQVMKYNGTSWVASSITNAQTYLGTWNATANNPDLTIPSSMPGDYYIVSVAGTFNSVIYAVGDWIISDGYNWQKVANSAVVVSTFNGRRGIVTLVPGDYVSLKNGSGKVPGSSLNDLADIDIVSPVNGSVLKYDTGSSKWIVGVDSSGGGAYSGTASRAVVTDGAGALTTSATTSAELGYVAGVTSAIQTQINAKLGTALANGNIFVGNGSGAATAVALSGDATIINTGAITLKNTGTAGTYTSVTTDSQGRVTAGTNPAIAAITALTGDVTASGTGSVTATIASGAVTTGKILDGTILPTDLDFTGTNIGTSGLVIRNLTGGFTPLVCSTVGHVPTWTVTGFICQAPAGGGSFPLLASPLGTATAPAYSFTGDTGTGMYSDVAGHVKFSAVGKTVLDLQTATNSVNYFVMTPAATGVSPILSTGGSDTDAAGLGMHLKTRNSNVNSAGPIKLTTGNGSGAVGIGGHIQLLAGDGSGSSVGVGGGISLNAGGGGGGIASIGGNIDLTAGDADSNGTGGHINLVAGNAAGLRGNITLMSTAVGIGTTTPTSMLALGPEADRVIQIERRTTTAAGNKLTLLAGGARTSQTNLAGGELQLSSGTSTGTAGSFVSIHTATGGTTGTADRAPTEKVRVDSTGRVGIGTSSPSYKLHVVGTAGATVGYFSDGSATCSITPATAGNISCSSDARLKKNIEFFSDLKSLDNILKLKTVTYEWKVIDNGRHTGFIAQDVEKIAPEFVTNGEDGFKQVSYAGLIPWITGAIKAFYGEFKFMAARVLRLEEKVAAKERSISSINAKVVKLESDNILMKNKIEALKKENELMEAKLARIEKFIQEAK